MSENNTDTPEPSSVFDFEPSHEVFDQFFGEEKTETVAEVVPAAEAEPETPTEVEPEKDTSDAEVDWEEAPKPSEADDEEPKDESAARQQAKIKGREAKELKAKLTERELELDKIQKEREELRAKLEEVEATKIKPEDHSDYVSLRDEILSDVNEAADLLVAVDPSLVSKNFGSFMAEYLEMVSLSGDDRTAARATLKGSIVDKLGLSNTPYAELDVDERKEFEGTVTDILKLVQRNSGKTKELQKLHATLSDKAKSGLLSTGVRQYENTVSEFRPVLDSLGSLADDLIEANPHAISSVVSKMVKESPEAAKRLEKAKADFLEIVVGPRALTQSEIDKLEKSGENVKEFLAERAKAHRAKQLKLAPFFIEGLMTRSTLKETLAELHKLKRDAKEEDSELTALRSTTKKSPPAKKEEPKRLTPMQMLGLPESEDF
jgi:hypothetical protein